MTNPTASTQQGGMPLPAPQTQTKPGSTQQQGATPVIRDWASI